MTEIKPRLTGACVWYLTTGAVLAVTRVALLVRLTHRFASHVVTQTDYFIVLWLYPEFTVSNFWGHLGALYRTAYYLAWGTLVTVGSFVMTTPILLVGWLTSKRTTPRLSR